MVNDKDDRVFMFFFSGLAALHVKKRMESGSVTSKKHHWCFLLVVLPLCLFFFQVTSCPTATTGCVSLEKTLEDHVIEGKGPHVLFNSYKVV